ncbi:carbohydrate ABC transporter permease [Agromyces sp. NPDC056523]|uniref:carbohydrate ABC transporter permease n=1 Tax=Agromyces sp. NPDC056523 TaxID=3345850 RepID=UPI00366D6AB0
MSTATRPGISPEPESIRGTAGPPSEAASAGAGDRRSGRRRARRRNVLSALLFLSPWIIGFLVFTAWPMIYSAYLSLTDYDVINNPEFVGIQNYVDLASDDKLLLALGNTVFFTMLQVPLYVLVSLTLALLLDRAGRASGFFRTVFFLPKMTPPVAVGVLFLLLFNGQNGLVNGVLGIFGIDGPSWTTDPAWVKPGLVFMSLWTVGASVIILLAALRNVPKELYESAQLDGAGFWRQSFSVTLPMISPALFFIIVVNTIAALQTFDEAYTAFFGAGNTTYSNDAALFYVIYLFQQAFEFLHMGYASAMAWLLFLIIMVITAIQLVVSRRLVYYEGDR